ncbi:KTSC domain-containing protein [Salinibacterium sp. ZJ450]|uniref:KTSC domain-containing protein n=1 Tax=Salinibacterium sp. ZJ450 TaxID=2708338 RepID=UPI00351D16FD
MRLRTRFNFNMDLEPIASSNLSAIGYDRHRGVLTVRFMSGGTYEYFDVAESLFANLLAAQPHPWTRHGREVKAHRYLRVG